MTEFKLAYLIGIENEGGYVIDKSDIGGETYKGISRRFYPEWEGWKLIDIIKKHRTIKRGEILNSAEIEGLVFNFYEKNFWNKIKGNEINNQQVANFVYDWTLTSGGAIKEIQKALSLTPDGVVGSYTLEKLNKIDSAEKFELLKRIRSDYYRKISKIGNNGKFLKGWLARVDRFIFK